MLRAIVLVGGVLAFGLFFLATRTASAEAATFWRTEVGSVLVVNENSPNNIEISYVEVPPQNTRFGVSPGTVMFEGRRAANEFNGTAIAFMDNGCRISYPMRISIEDGP